MVENDLFNDGRVDTSFNTESEEGGLGHQESLFSSGDVSQGQIGENPFKKERIQSLKDQLNEEENSDNQSSATAYTWETSAEENPYYADAA